MASLRISLALFTRTAETPLIRWSARASADEGEMQAPEVRQARFSLMPLYFFHVSGCPLESEAGEGLDYPDDLAARAAALAGARGMIAEEVLHGRLDLKCSIDVADEHGTILFSVPFASTLAGS